MNPTLGLQRKFQDPVIAADGYTYEYAAIAHWLQTKKHSPVTHKQLQHKLLVPNLVLKGFCKAG